MIADFGSLSHVAFLGEEVKHVIVQLRHPLNAHKWALILPGTVVVMSQSDHPESASSDLVSDLSHGRVASYFVTYTRNPMQILVSLF